MSKLKELALMIGLSSLSTPYIGTSSGKDYGIKKSVMPKKDYAKRKKRNKMARKSKQINRQ